MKEELQKIIGRNLYRIRHNLRLTREAVADRVGISVTFYSNLESGNRMMSVVTLYKLAKALGVSTDTLLNSEYGGENTQNIDAVLRGQPARVVSLVEKIARVCAQNLSDTDWENTEGSDCGKNGV